MADTMFSSTYRIPKPSKQGHITSIVQIMSDGNTNFQFAGPQNFFNLPNLERIH